MRHVCTSLISKACPFIHEIFGDFCRMINFPTFLSKFRSEKFFMPPLSFIVARTKLSFVHYTWQFPWCAIRPAQNFGTSGFFPCSICVYSFLLHMQYHLVLMVSLSLSFSFSPCCDIDNIRNNFISCNKMIGIIIVRRFV